MPHITLGEAIKKCPEWKAYLTATYEKAKAEREVLIASFRNKLSGDKLRIFDTYFGTDGENEIALTTPDQMANTKVWARGSVDTEHYIQPRWKVNIFSFEEMKLVGQHEEIGWVYNAPSSVYKWQKNK